MLIKNIEFHDSCVDNLTIDGTLSIAGSFVAPTGVFGLLGTGTLILRNTADAAVDHDWASGFVKVTNVKVTGGAHLKVRDAVSQLGPDAAEGSGGLWEVGSVIGGNYTAGSMEISGSHTIGFNTLKVGRQGEVTVTGDGSWFDVARGLGAVNDAFLVWNHNKFEVTEGTSLWLVRGWYKQSLQTEPQPTEPTTTMRPDSLIGSTHCHDSAFPPAYAFNMTVGKLVAYENVNILAESDILVEGSTIEFFNAGEVTKPGEGPLPMPGPVVVSTLQFTSRISTTDPKTTVIRSTQIKFLDWNPAGRYATTTMEGGFLNVTGHLRLEGTTSILARGDVTSTHIDVLSASLTMTLEGDLLALHLDLRGAGELTERTFFDFLRCAPDGLTAPGTPFGGGTTVTAGWTLEILMDANTMDLKVTKP